MNDNATICAIATAPGNGAIAVLRLSGEQAFTICDQVFKSKSNKKLTDQQANTIHFGNIVFENNIIDEVLVSIFKAPHSYTGEHVVEVSCHGATVIQQKLLEVFIKIGARLAQPGEFTLRAFLNGKMDLSQAEGVADLIAATSGSSHRVALNQMRGGFSNEIKQLRDQLLQFISLIELELDFSEEDVEFADRAQLKNLIVNVNELIVHLRDSFQLGNAIKNGIPVAIVGHTNVGKSTLLNAILNEERAIVSDIAGTTRDVIEDSINIDGISFRFIDTAGIRDTQDKIEAIGIERTFAKIDQADIVIQLVEADDDLSEIKQTVKKVKNHIEGTDKHFLLVVNKIDKMSEAEFQEKFNKQNFPVLTANHEIIFISAKEKQNLRELTDALLSVVNTSALNEGETVVTNARHFEALNGAYEALTRALNGMEMGMTNDFLAQDIREALHYLGTITGEITTDEILGNIFSKFCIGK